MAQEKRSTGDGRVPEALDLCLARMRRGESLEHCLLDFGDLAQELRPLLAVMQDLLVARDAPIPAPPRGLVPGRARFLAAATGSPAAAPTSANGHPAVETAFNGHDRDVVEALDACLHRLRAGERIDLILAGFPLAVADAVRPLVALAADVMGTAAAAPPAPAGLAAGRARFLAAAAAVSAAPATAVGAGAFAPADDAQIEQLDACLARVRAGEAIERVVAEHSDAAARQLHPLVALASALRADAVAPPAPPAGLAMGRARFLDVAARSRSHHAAVAAAGRRAAQTVASANQQHAPVLAGWLPRVSGWFTRIAAAATLACAVFLVGTLALENTAAVANALPGEPAYYVKRLNERIDLWTTFDPQARVRLENALDIRRAAEADRLIDLGRVADVSFRAVFLGLEAGPGGAVRVRVPTDGDAGERWLTLGDGTQLTLGGYGSLADVPPGALLMLTVRTDPATGGRSLILSLEVTGVTVAGAGAEPSAPSGDDRVAVLPTAVARTGAEPTAPAADQPPTATFQPTAITPTLPPPTPTLPLTSTPEPTVLRSEGKKAGDKLQGVVVDQPAEGVWVVGVGRCPQKLVRADVSGVEGVQGLDVRNHAVVLRGEYRDEAQTEFAATRLSGRPSPAPDSIAEAVGTVAELSGDGRMTLTDGRAFLIGGAKVTGVLDVGVTVTVRYRGCSSGTPEALEVAVQAPESPLTVDGTVADLVPDTSFTLIVQDDDPATPERVTVQIDADTPVRNAAGVAILANGQKVTVNGLFDGVATVRATSIFVLDGGDASDPPEGGSGGFATPVPSPTPLWPDPPPPTSEPTTERDRGPAEEEQP